MRWGPWGDPGEFFYGINWWEGGVFGRLVVILACQFFGMIFGIFGILAINFVNF